ncbi:hypothetical protein ES332_A06G188600v1 [Gossypium tomentosum]|uniref:non-specific serine/threonine protein kinase n=1 Tax=Gossypium tomentosum TaxID=34277 RepID=A0A5D2Q5W9_GOSTO|nr:hypothetical protein ES332_A06G188600v1 [Gossypium tomentosum]
MFSFRVVVLILGCLRLTEAERDTLNPGDKLISNSSDNLLWYYLAMWYAQGTLTSNNHSIWLANRDNLIAGDSGVLVLDDTGLKITRTGGNPIQVFSLQSTSITINTSDMKVVLQDSGNLVLQGTNEENRENVVLWQSFDHPTDSFLPVMKLGVSHGRNFSLTSWFSDSIPASRSFTMEWDPARNRLVVRLRERILWTNGEDFENIGPSDPFNMNYDFTNVSNPNWKYVYYTLVIYNTTKNGCERWEGPKCRKKDSLNDTLYGNTNLSLNDCKDICWKDCKCLGVEAEKDLGCRFILGHYEEGVLDGLSFQLIIRNCPKSKTWIWILISLAIALMIIVLLSTLFYLRRRRQIRKEEEYLLDLMTSEDASDVSELQTGNNGRNLNIYTAGLIMSAKNGFSPDNLLGKGGFGGFCVQGEEKMLVYDYMPNKSLDTFIFAIEGITQGLLYLHKYSRLRIIHRDLKLSNILLDENMNPKISDFGLAKIYITNAAGSNTKQIVGRYYMSPEYAMEGIFSEKSDDYSFRVMVLEVVSGQKNSNHFEFDRPLNLVGYELRKHGGALQLMDPALSDSCFKRYQVLRCITLSLLCVEDNPLDRTTMSDVISVLIGKMQLALPKQPAIRIVETYIESKEVEIYSLNGLTVSTMDAR